MGLVDAVGGIEICPKEDMVDADANLRIKKGCQEVDGEVALAYARSRHAQELGDLDRAAHQREVVSAVGNEAVSPWSVINPFRWWNLNMAAADFVNIDEDTGPVTAAKFAAAMTQVDGENGLTCGVPISDLAVHWDDERAERMFQKIQQDDTASIGKELCSPSGLVATWSVGDYAANEPPISRLWPTKVATTVAPLGPATVTSTSYTPERALAAALGGGRGEHVAEVGRGAEADLGAGGDRTPVVAVAGEREGRVGQGEGEAAVADGVAVDHVLAHGHPDHRPTGADLDDLHAERLAGPVAGPHRRRRGLGDLLRSGHPRVRPRSDSSAR